MGPLHLYTDRVDKELVSFLLVWRMALDHLASATSSWFGKDSKQWEAFEVGRRRAYDTHFGYRVVDAMRNRVQHQERPPLTHTLLRYPYTCDECDKEHADLDLAVSLPKEWFLSSQCPRLLKQDLTATDRDDIDIRAAVDESMQGFRDILYVMTMASDEAPGHLASLVNVFDETEPLVPVLVEWHIDGKPRATSLREFDSMAWVVKRSTLQHD
jgi:hypothetical protein